MSELAAEFFKRNFTEAEWAELERLVLSSPQEAERLAALAEEAYLKTGLPAPQWPQGKLLRLPRATGGMGSLGPWIALSVAMGIGVLTWRWWVHAPQAPATGQALVASANPAASQSTASPAPQLLFKTGGQVLLKAHDFPPPPMAIPRKVAENTAEAGQLAVVVELEDAEPVTVKVLDNAGEVQRVLFTGPLKPGQWSIRWDGLMPDGKPARSGRYRIQVQAGPNFLAKEVEIAGGQPEEVR